MTSRQLIPLAFCSVLLLSGCGGDDEEAAGLQVGGTPSPSSRSVDTSSADPAKLATAGVLTSADLSGWSREAQTNDAATSALERAVKDCLKLPATPYVERNEGFTYKKGGVEVSSDADVAATTAQAVAEVAALGSAAGPRCYRDALAEILPPGSEVDVGLEKATVAGADGAVAYQLSASFSADGTPVLITGYELVALVDRVMIWLDSSEETKTPTYSLAKLVEHAEKLVKRVKAAAKG